MAVGTPHRIAELLKDSSTFPFVAPSRLFLLLAPSLPPPVASPSSISPSFFQRRSYFPLRRGPENLKLISPLSLLPALPPFRSSSSSRPTEQSLKAPPYVLLDLTHRDSKTRSLLEIVECRDSIWRDVFSLEAGLGGLVGKEEGGVLLGAF